MDAAVDQAIEAPVELPPCAAFAEQHAAEELVVTPVGGGDGGGGRGTGRSESFGHERGTEHQACQHFVRRNVEGIRASANTEPRLRLDVTRHA